MQAAARVIVDGWPIAKAKEIDPQAAYYTRFGVFYFFLAISADLKYFSGHYVMLVCVCIGSIAGLICLWNSYNKWKRPRIPFSRSSPIEFGSSSSRFNLEIVVLSLALRPSAHRICAQLIHSLSKYLPGQTLDATANISVIKQKKIVRIPAQSWFVGESSESPEQIIASQMAISNYLIAASD